MSQFLPYWNRHPHQLRVFAFVMIALSPILFPLIGLLAICWHAWDERRGICGLFAQTYAELWAGLTHRMPAKPVIRPVAAFVLRVIAYLIPIWLFLVALAHLNGPNWAVVAIALAYMIEMYASESRGLRNGRKKARKEAGSERHIDEHETCWHDL